MVKTIDVSFWINQWDMRMKRWNSWIIGWKRPLQMDLLGLSCSVLLLLSIYWEHHRRRIELSDVIQILICIATQTSIIADSVSSANRLARRLQKLRLLLQLLASCRTVVIHSGSVIKQCWVKRGVMIWKEEQLLGIGDLPRVVIHLTKYDK